ncbi:MAG: glucosaminidase domain-containing protein [Proteobacteria bacterium]|nr:glucosaminidase domain-containing protein [Pseudomonadota bacterium]
MIGSFRLFSKLNKHHPLSPGGAVFSKGIGVSIMCVFLILAALPARSETIEIKSFDDLDRYFTEKDYAIQKWKDGTQKVPRLAILDIPEGWRKRVAPHMTVSHKKRTFFRVGIPLVFLANQQIAEERARLLALREKHPGPGPVPPPDADWIREKSAEYSLPPAPVDGRLMDVLADHMDIVPPSLVVAQMADESGWGTSRFAAEGNALFGQWTYHGGLMPKDQRNGKGDYRIKAFKSPLQSVQAYMLNLNSGKPYAGFREERKKLRAAEEELTGLKLVATLINYSERHEAYVRDIENLIRHNKLMGLDQASLAPGETVFVRLHAGDD